MEFAGGEVGIEEEAGAGLNECFLPGLAQGGDIVSGPAVLPDDGRGDGSAGFPIPDDDGFALVGDTEGGEVGGGAARFLDGLAGRGDDGLPDFHGVVLDASGLREVLAEFLLRAGQRAAAIVINDGTRAGGALVEGEKGQGEWRVEG